MQKTTTITFALVFLAATSLIAFAIQVAQANPHFGYPRSVFLDVPPPEGAQAPIVAIHAPQNGSTYSKNETLTYEVRFPDKNVGLFELYYKGNWDPEKTVIPKDKFGAFPNSSYSIDLSDVWGGNISITVYAVGVGFIYKCSEVVDSFHSYNYYDRFEIAGYSTVSFVKDLVPPKISVQSPQNTTYTTPNVKLDFIVNENISQSLYNLDNKGNQTIPGNSTLTELSNGEHSITLYVADLAGNAADPKTINFSVDLPEPFPILLVAVSITVVVLAVMSGGLLLSRNHQKHTTKSKQ